MLIVFLPTFRCLATMPLAISFLLLFPLVVRSHVHVSGIPLLDGGFYQRLFEPVDPNFCNAQDQQIPISCLQDNPQGTPYCSSFLNIPIATVWVFPRTTHKTNDVNCQRCTTATIQPVAGTTTITLIVTAPAIVRRSDTLNYVCTNAPSCST